MTTTSSTGLTVTVMLVVLEPPLELVAVRLKTSGSGASRLGTVGAVNVTVAPVAVCVPLSVNVTPEGALQENVSVPPEGSTPVALSVTNVLLATGLAGDALANTEGGVPGGGTAIGTATTEIAGVVVLPPPTVNWKVRFSGVATTGAMNVAVGEFGLVMVTNGSPGLTSWIQANGPLMGVLPVELSETRVPATIGVATAVNVARAWA